MKPIIKVVKKSGPYYGSAFDPGILIGTLSMTTRQALAFYEALTGAPYKCP